MIEKVNCCFCGLEIPVKESHNPNNADSTPGARCCLYCNYKIVLPVRAITSTIIREAKQSVEFPGPNRFIKIPDFSSLLVANESAIRASLEMITNE